MKRWESVTIIGVGLIGASIGLALRERRLAKNVVGVGRRASSLRKAKACGAVTATTTNLERGVSDAELIVVCTPVELIVQRAVEAAALAGPGTLITDAGSTKAEIVRTLDRSLQGNQDVDFVGSHPMAGSEKTGPTHARADLFEGRVSVVTPTTRTSNSARDAIEEFWRSLGANVVRLSPRQHDRTVAMISHLPHVISSAVAASTPDADLPLASTGWLDTTRIAAGDPELWRQILSDNRADVLKSLGKFEKVLASFRRALERDDQRKLIQLLEAGKQRREALGN
ncbi:MAG: prephenate dehydrogenase [Planctomycetaceae bacterium]|nr:prephenate dehydrogenase [Planctomycetaceae bacterium]